ncbi:MAG: hypothetical protein R3F19_28100 [Verrucomicrobiales bacterium]
MSPKASFSIVVFLVGLSSSCGSLQKGADPNPRVANIKVGFRNDSKLVERWSVEDANTNAMVFHNEEFKPGEVKAASISTGPSQRFGEVRYKDSKAISWTRDSLIETDRVVELRGSDSEDAAGSAD